MYNLEGSYKSITLGDEIMGTTIDDIAKDVVNLMSLGFDIVIFRCNDIEVTVHTKYNSTISDIKKSYEDRCKEIGLG